MASNGQIEPSSGLPVDARDAVLDGWRGLAALFVAVAHGAYFRLYDIGDRIYPGLSGVISQLGQVAVLLFFTISGFVITSLMLREEAARGRVSISAFYVRRGFRILPPLALYALALVALHYASYFFLTKSDMIRAAFFVCNLGTESCGWWIGHSWTLAIEEQFYLLWPILFIAARRWRRLLVGVTLVALIVMIEPNTSAVRNNALGFACIAVGAYYALEPRLRILMQRSSAWWLWLASVAIMLSPEVGGWLLPAAPLLVLYVVFASKEICLVRRALESRPLQLLGMGSYSLYLWQQLFMAKPVQYLGATAPLWLLPVAVIVSVVCVERPFIRWGRTLSTRIQAG